MTCVFLSPIGKLSLTIENDAITRLAFSVETLQCNVSTNLAQKKMIQELNAYFNGELQDFSVKLKPQGTLFQQRVWHELKNIPYGKTRTYGDLAKKLNTSPRAVGNACRTNPILILIPCHRVISKNSLGGYCGNIKGDFLEVKKLLIKLEQKS